MSRPLRILMTADTVGGVWTYSMELAAALAAQDVEILLATMGVEPTLSQQRAASQLPHVHLVGSAYKLEWMEEPWRDVEAAGDWLLHLAEEFQPDLVHLNGFVHADLPWHVPVLVVAHSCVLSWWSSVKGEYAPRRLAEYGRRVGRGLRCADLIVAPTHAMLEMLGEQYAFATEGRVIPNGRRCGLFAPGSKEPFIFGAGRLWDEAKNLSLLNRLAPELPWPVRLAGPPMFDSQSAAAEHGGAEFLGELSPGEMAHRLSAASIYAAPALYEPFGLGILEAALSGCALVLSDIPSLRENWHDAALLVPADNEDAWRDTLQSLARNEPHRRQLAARARQRALRFAPEAMAGAYHQLYLELTSKIAREQLEPCFA